MALKKDGIVSDNRYTIIVCDICNKQEKVYSSLLGNWLAIARAGLSPEVV